MDSHEDIDPVLAMLNDFPWESAPVGNHGKPIDFYKKALASFRQKEWLDDDAILGTILSQKEEFSLEVYSVSSPLVEAKRPPQIPVGIDR